MPHLECFYERSGQNKPRPLAEEAAQILKKCLVNR